MIGADGSSAPDSNAPRPNLWRRLPAGARLGIILALALGIAGVIMGTLRIGSEGVTEQAKPVSDAGAVPAATVTSSAPSAAKPAAALPAAAAVAPSADVVPRAEVDGGTRATAAVASGAPPRLPVHPTPERAPSQRLVPPKAAKADAPGASAAPKGGGVTQDHPN